MVSIDVGGIHEAVIDGESGILISEYCEYEFASTPRNYKGMKKICAIRLKARENDCVLLSLTTKMMEGET